MRLPAWFGALSRRTFRVFVLTLLLTTVACECDDNDDLANCFSAVFGSTACVGVPKDLGSTVRYVPTGSDCNACSSPCNDVVEAHLSELGYCIDGCKFVCN